MKAKEDISLKCAIGGGLVGVVLGLLDAVVTLNKNGADFMSLLQAALSLMLWIFVMALASGGFAYLVLWWMDRRLGRHGAAETGPDAILQKASFLRALNVEAQKSCADIASHVTRANMHLNAAEKEFTAGAFAPFWDEVENAANELAAYKNEVEHLRRSVDVYKNDALELEMLSVPAPPLEISERSLPDARPSATRFMGIVRKAQTNFQFAVIFEQRKTNQLLHAGFGTLGAAIYSLGESISSSLDTLSVTLDKKAGKLIADKTEQKELMRNLYDRQKDQAQALDHIQRREKPGL